MIQILWMFLAFFHPFYVGVTEIKHNNQSKKVEISCKLFYDDLENTLQHETGKKIDILNPKNSRELNLQIKDYVLAHISLVINDKNISLSYLGYELQEDAIWCYIESEKVGRIKKLQVNNNLLYKYYKTQMHIISTDIGGAKQSKKIANPEREAIFSY